MEWFSEWWNALALAEQILYLIAIPSSLLLIIQTIMILVGFGGGGEGMNFSDTSGLDGDLSGDFSGDISDVPDIAHDGSSLADIADFRLFSVQSVVTFLCIFGWSGIVAIANGLPTWAALLISCVLGFAAMVGVAKVIQLSSRLAQNGTFDVKNLLGEDATVYIPIPPKGEGIGKITVKCGERFMEFDAVSELCETISTQTPVRITDIIAGSTLVVERI